MGNQSPLHSDHYSHSPTTSPNKLPPSLLIKCKLPAWWVVFDYLEHLKPCHMAVKTSFPQVWHRAKPTLISFRPSLHSILYFYFVHLVWKPFLFPKMLLDHLVASWLMENIPCTKACFHIQIIINKLCSCSSLSRQVCELGTFSWSEWEYRIELLVISRCHCSGPDTHFNTCLAFILHEHVNNVCNNSCCIIR